MKKLLAIILAIAMMCSFAACSSSEPDDEITIQEPPDVILVTDETGLGDEAFNDLCWAGCSKAAEDFGVEIYCISSENGDDYLSKLTEAVGMEPQLIVCAGAALEGALTDIAASNPDMKFAIVDSKEIGDNVAGITFCEQEGAFLAGIAAGIMSKSNVISFIGGEMSVVLDRFQYGFEAGIRTINKNIYINNQYLGNFTDKAAAKTLASAHQALGSDILYHAAGEAGQGVIEAAKATGAWAIGVDVDQSYLAPETVLFSVVKKADIAVYNMISSVLAGEFDGSDVTYDLADGAVGISDNAGNLPDEVKVIVDEYAQKIIKGEIVVPYDWQTCWDYTLALPEKQEVIVIPEANKEEQTDDTESSEE